MKKHTTIGVIIVIVVLVAVNIFASVLVNKFSLELDMTSSGIYKISQESVDLMKNVGKEVNIYCVCKSKDSVKEFSELLDKYAAASPQIKVQYVDPYSSVVYLDKLKEEGIDIGLNTIIIECNGNRRIYEMSDMYEFNSDGSEVTYFDGESKITSAIVSLSSGQSSKIGMTLGHGENMPDKFQSLLTTNGYEIGGLVLNKEVPEEIKTLLILAPQSDFSEAETAMLDKFMARGGALAVFVDPAATKLTNLEAFLADWQVVFNDDVIYDAKNNIESNPVNVMSYYGEHDITKYFSTHQYYTIVPASRSIEGDFSNYTGKNTLGAVLMTGDSAYGRDITADQTSTEKTDKDTSGPFLLAMTSTRKNDDNSTAKLFAMGSKRVYADDMLGKSSIGNAKFIAQVINWCDNGNGVAVSIAPKQIGAEDISISTGMSYAFGVLFVIIIPVTLIICGIRIYLKRRHL